MSTSSLEIRANQNQLTRSPISLSFSDVPGSRHRILIDIACIIITLLSLALFITLAALTGYYADIEDYETANKFFTSQNLVWPVWGSIYMIIMLYLWVKFVGVAWDNMSDLNRAHAIRSAELQTKFDQLKRGCKNLSIPVIGQTVTALICLPAFLLYGLFHRTNTIFNFNINILYLSPLSSTRSIIKDADHDNSGKYSQSNDRKQEETDNDIISEVREKLKDDDPIYFNFIKPKHHHRHHSSFGGSTIVKHGDQFFTSPYPSNFNDNDTVNNSVIGSSSSIPFINTNITTTNDSLKKIPQNFRRQSDSSLSKQQKQRRSPSTSPLSLRGLTDSIQIPKEIVHQEMVLSENPLSPLSPSSTIFDRRRSGNQRLKEWLLKKPTPAIPRPQRLDSYKETPERLDSHKETPKRLDSYRE
ncbi:24437_t:CDS:2, partial [Cetraspora pellucida]